MGVTDSLKRCTRCKYRLPVGMFALNRTCRDGRQTQCRTCGMEAYRIKCADPVKRALLRAQGREKMRQYYWQCPEKRRARSKEYHVKNRARRNAWIAWYGLKMRYGITAEAYRQILAAQDGKCASCEDSPRFTSRQRHFPLTVDHDHVTGEIRGLLCGNCNSGLGHFRDDPDRLERAAAYLRRARLLGKVA